VDPFAGASSALHAAVDALPDDEFAAPSGCSGWLIRDLVCHLVIDAQDVLITLATPTDEDATRDAYSYWSVASVVPDGDDPLDALVVRLAAAYREPRLLRHHFDDVFSAARRAAALADADRRVSTQGFVLTARDFLSAFVLEWTLHHLDLNAHRPQAPDPPSDTLGYARGMLQRIAGVEFPRSLGDADVLRIGTGRRAPTPAEVGALGGLTERIPFVLG
jgi:uncharacterized protein (TIGR03083 family)